MKGKRKVLSCIVTWLMVFALVLTSVYAGGVTKIKAAEGSSNFQQKIEFEDANHFSSDSGNKIDTYYSNYSGSGYVYLTSGWAEVNFTVPSDGKYKITIASTSDQHKENWLYFDNDGAGTLNTESAGWGVSTYEYSLTAGTHKFGVSTNWGYVALDYVIIQSEGSNIQPTVTPSTKTSVQPTVIPTASSNGVYEFEDANSFSSDSGNKIAHDTFPGYSGSGYVYLTSGWAEVRFTVPSDGKYEITIASTSDQHKENWLYLDDEAVGTLETESNSWGTVSNTYTLSKGTHKFGVSSSWGYVALDYVKVKAVSTPTTSVAPTATASVAPTPTPTTTGSTGKGMYVKNTRLYDGNGNEFIMRGINIAHAWYTDKTDTSIKAVADLGANCVRVVLADGAQWTKTRVSEVQNIINICRKNKLVCVLEVHDHTGKDNTSELDTAVNYWLEIKDILNANKDYVIVNIANEWLGTWGLGDTWKNTYCKAVSTIRNAGIENVIMVDAAGYGQETSSMIDNCQSVKAADSTGNIMFSIHMYSCAGSDAATVKSNIDNTLSKNVCLCIGEFGDYQNGADVDEATIISYCNEKGVGNIAWSWKGNGGQDATLDLSKDWAGTNLTDWGKTVVSNIQKTSKLAYYLTGYGDAPIETPPTISVQPTESTTPVTSAPPVSGEIGISADKLTSFDTDWFISGEGDDTTSTISSLDTLSNNGLRVNFDLTKEAYPYLTNMVAGVDLSAHDTISIVVRNNNAYALQIQPIFKVGSLWKWTEYDQYQTVPAATTTLLTFDMSSCSRDEVQAIMFRVQGAEGKFAGTVDFISMGYDLGTNAYADEIAELNRPKSASCFTWVFPETSWTEKTVTSSCDSDGVLSVEFKNVTDSDAAGIQTETKPGLGKGMDFSGYDSITCTIKNTSTSDIHVSLVLRTGSNWTWQENGGMVTGEKEGERVISAGESVDVTYYLNHKTWKSKQSGWKYTGALEESDDVRALGFKIYAGSNVSASGKVTVSDFQCNF